ncbi:Ubiquitin carboxyl-terminal hydrolase 9 [Candida viswanathii]|uniref:Ubiquitin carboxyl-terminal hydrolase n=1 Tax=Candida viswanathii TaxID=5486 RepID=A0A367YN68_9ASCO|nr:Ubiquitin carboxyl-terminal hydrolase 9 [Candida viswanathii]
MGNLQTNNLPYGDGSHKIFGMENFGNTCYCNSILQCLYYTENFRTQLIQHNQIKHEPKLIVAGFKPHNFTSKYEQLVVKKLKEQGGKSTSVSSTLEERPKPASRRGSLFGLKFNNNSSSSAAASGNTATPTIVTEDPKKKYGKYITLAKDCEALSLEQRIKISKSPEFQKLDILITRPLVTQADKKLENDDRNDYSQSSSMLLNDQPQQTTQEGPISATSSAIIVGIPHPETNLTVPINPFNANPSGDQRKRSALINGPIINLDLPLQTPGEINEDTALLYALRDLFESMVENKSTIGVVSPSYFIQKLKEKNFLFRQNNMHHDAHEFFNYLINEIIESVNKEDKLDGFNWCSDIFRGLITNETKCLSCETVTSKQELFLDLSVDIPPGESSFSLTYALNNFSKSETLTNQNKFYCNTCSSLQEAVKTIKVKKLPKVLVINLKRFKYDEQMDKMVKLFDSISYPLKLRLFNTTDDESLQDQLYELYALVIHIGGGPMHGHYVSICKIKAGLWLLFDDETVELVEDSYVLRFFGDGPGLASAYILFYRQGNYNADFGFDPEDIYDGTDEYSMKQGEDEISTLATSVNNEQAEPKSDTSSIASFNPAEAAKKPSPLKSFMLDKEEKFVNPLSRTNSRGHLPTPPPAAVVTGPEVHAPYIPQQPQDLPQPPPMLKDIKEKKSWVGSLKRRKDESSSSGNSGAPPIERKASTSSTASGNERRRSIFGFKRK